MGKAALTLLWLFAALSHAQMEVGTTDRDAALLIRGVREEWRLHYVRDEAHIAKLREQAKSTRDDGFRYLEMGQRWNRATHARNGLATYYEDYELFDFRVIFFTPEEAVVTYKAVATMRRGARRVVKSIYAEIHKMKKAGRWHTVTNVMGRTR